MAEKTKRGSKRPAPRLKRGAIAHSRRRAVSTRGSEEQLRLAREALGMVTWTWDVVRDRVQWFGDPAQLLGQRSGSFSGRFDDYLKSVHPEDRAQARATYAACFKGERTTYRAEERVVWPDGSVHWIETYGRGRYDRSGRAVAMSGTLIDCTERKRHEQEIARSRELLDKAFGASPDYMVFTRLDDGCILNVNDTFEKVSGYSRAESVGRTVAELGLWAEPGQSREFADLLKREGTLRDFRARLRMRDGREILCLVSAALLQHEDRPAAFAIVRDITAKEETERRLQRSERTLAAVFSQVPTPIVITRRRDGVIIDCNHAWATAIGRGRDEIVGQTGQTLGAWRDAEARSRLLAKVETEGRAEDVAARFLRPDGTSRDMLVSCVRIELEGEAHLLWSSRDVTEINRAAARERMLLGKYAAVFSTSRVAIAISRRSDGIHVEVNDAWVRLMHVPRERAIGRSALELGMWESPGERDSALDSLATDGVLANHPARFLRGDGHAMDVLLSGALVELDGEACVVWSWSDISELQDARRKAVQAERKYAALFETSPSGMIVSRPGERRVVEINDAALAALGIRREDAIGTSIGQAVRYLDPGQMARARARALAGERVQGELVGIEDLNGRKAEILLSMTSVDIDGEPHLLTCTTDVTEQRGQQRVLSESEERFQKAFQSSHEAIGIARLVDGRIVAANRGMEALYGAPAEEMVGKTTTELDFWPGGDGERDRLMEALRRDGRIRDMQVRVRTRSGMFRTCNYSSDIVDIGGEPHVIAFLRDITELRVAEDARRESEQRFEAAFYNSSIATAITRLSDGTIVAVNRMAEELYGEPAERMVGRTVRELDLWGDNGKTGVHIAEQLRTHGRIRDMEMRLRTHSGAARACLYSADLLDIGGEPHVIGFARDLTDLRAAEEARRETEERYRHLFQHALDSIALLTPDGELLEVNPNLCSETGYAREELLGRSFEPLVGADSFRHMMAELKEARSRGALRFEFEFKRRDGTSRPVEVRAGWLSQSTIQIVVHDIGERKRSEELLMNLARGVSAELGASFFRSLVSHLSSRLGADYAFLGEIVGDARDRVRTLAYCADGAEQPNFEYALDGSPCVNAISQRGTVAYEQGVAELFPGDAGLTRLGVQGYVGTSLFDSKGMALGVLVIMSRKPIEQMRHWSSILEIFASRAAAEIERSRAEARVSDLNLSLERRVLERTAELEDANRELESYNFSISHDLRQPLNAISGFAELLRDHVSGALEASAQECVGEIEANAARMEKMIEALLRLSRAGRGALQKTSVDMREIVESVLRDAAVGAPLAAEIAMGELPAAQGDPVLLRQVWANLLGNALKYSHRSDAPRVEIGASRRNGAFEYRVRDNGVGFDMRDAERVFDPFHRLPTASQFEGSGVGLAIVQRIVRRHGGTISAESAPGSGATFRFTLPD